MTTLEQQLQEQVELVWTSCSTCWGQRKLLSPVRRPTGALIGYVPSVCPTCLGLGETARIVSS